MLKYETDKAQGVERGRRSKYDTNTDQSDKAKKEKELLLLTFVYHKLSLRPPRSPPAPTPRIEPLLLSTRHHFRTSLSLFLVYRSLDGHAPRHFLAARRRALDRVGVRGAGGSAEEAEAEEDLAAAPLCRPLDEDRPFLAGEEAAAPPLDFGEGRAQTFLATGSSEVAPEEAPLVSSAPPEEEDRARLRPYFLQKWGAPRCKRRSEGHERGQGDEGLEVLYHEDSQIEIIITCPVYNSL